MVLHGPKMQYRLPSRAMAVTQQVQASGVVFNALAFAVAPERLLTALERATALNLPASEMLLMQPLVDFFWLD